MAELKISQFCSLSTSPSWHVWLYNYDIELYNKYMAKLRESKGCSYNRQLMIQTLEDIKRIGGYSVLYDFIKSNYPYMVVDDYKLSLNEDKNNVIFPGYRPNILTYPKRIIFSGEKEDLVNRINHFVRDKLKHDHIIIGNQGYVEYLDVSDKHIVDKIPMNNWLIANYRKNNI